MIRCVDVSLVIPDNEARTALSTLQRLGIGIARLERTDLYRCDVAAGSEGELVAALRALEPIFNPNKHALRVRAQTSPVDGEVWIDERASAPVPAAAPVRIAGRTLLGVFGIERFTAWRLFDEGGPAARSVVAAAAETLLCNSAFQKALFSESVDVT